MRNSKTSEFESSNSNRNKSTIEPKISNIDFITFENEENKEENKNSPNQFRIKEIPNPNYTSLNNSSNIISKFNDSGTSFKNNTRHSLSKNSNFINGSLSPIKKPKLSNNNLQNIINKEINNNPIKIIDLNEIESNNKIKIKDKETYSVKSPSSLTKNKSNFAEISPRNNNNKKLGNIKLDKETLRELNHYTDRNFIKSIKASFRKLEIIEKINYENFSNSQNIFERENKNKNNEKSSFNIPSQDGSPINYCDLSGNSKGKEEFPKRNSTKSEANSPNINKKNKKECIFPSIIEDNNNLKNKFCNWSYSKNK